MAVGDFIGGLAQGFGRARLISQENQRKDKMAKLQGQLLELQLKDAQTKGEARQRISDALAGGGQQPAAPVGDGDLAGDIAPQAPQSPPDLLSILSDRSVMADLINSGADPTGLAKLQQQAQQASQTNALIAQFAPGQANPPAAGQGGVGTQGIAPDSGGGPPGGLSLQSMRIGGGAPSITLGPQEIGRREISADGKEIILLDKQGNEMRRLPAPPNLQPVQIKNADGSTFTAFVDPLQSGGPVIQTGPSSLDEPIGTTGAGKLTNEAGENPPPSMSTREALESGFKMKPEDLTAGDAGRVSGLAGAVKLAESIRSEIINKDGKVDRLMIANMQMKTPGTAGRRLAFQMEDAVDALFRARTGAAAPDAERKFILEQFKPSIVDDDPTILDKMDRLQRFTSGALDAINLPPKVRARLEKGVSGGKAPPPPPPGFQLMQ